MAYSDMSSNWAYKDLITYSDLNQLGENDTYMIRNNLGGQTITPATAVVGLTMDQNQDQIGIKIDSESTTYYGLSITGKYGLDITQDISSGRGLSVSRNIAEVGSLSLVKITEDHASSTQPVLEIQNDGSGEEIKFTNAVTRYYAVNPAACIMTGNSPNWDITGQRALSATTGAITFNAPINLPHGATITSLKVYFYRDDALATGAVVLFRSDFVGNGSGMANVDSNATTGYHSVEDTSISYPTIDNLSYTYVLNIILTPNNASGDVTFTGAVITCTIVEPLP